MHNPNKRWAQDIRCGLCAYLPVDARTLVVAPEKEDVFRILHLVGQDQADCLQRQLPSVQGTV